MRYHIDSVKDTVLVDGVDTKVKDKCYICPKGGESLERDRCQAHSNFQREAGRWWSPPQTGLCNRQTQTVWTFWKRDWLTLVIRVQLIKYRQALKRNFWSNFLIVWNVQQNKTLPEYRLCFIITPLKDPMKFTETYFRNLKKNKSSRILCPANFMSSKWQLEWLWNIDF